MITIFRPFVSNNKLLPIIVSSIILMIISASISILISVVILVILAAILILYDYRIGTLFVILFSFSSIAGQKIFESYHLFLLIVTLTLFSLSLSFLRGKIVLKGVKEFNFLFIIFGLWAFASGIIASNHHYWILNIELMIRAIMLFYLIINSFSTAEDVLLVFKTVVLTILISSVIPFVLSVGGLSISFSNLLPLFLTRFSGSVFDPNYFSMTVAGSVPLAIVLIVKEKNRFFRIIWIMSVLFLMFSIVISQSRTGLFSTAIVFVYALLYLFKKKRKEILVLVLPIVLLLLFLPGAFWYRSYLFLQSVFGNAIADSSTVQRLLLLNSAFDVFIKNPIWGVGLGNFEAIAGRYIHYPMVCHNTYLEVAANLGLLGLIPFLLILYRGFSVLKDPIRNPATSELAWGIKAGLLGSYIAIFFLSVPFKLDYWVLLGLSAVLSLQKSEKHGQ